MGMPFDLSDEATRAFAYSRFGPDGTPTPPSDEEIDRGLPDTWMCYRDPTGDGRHIYIDLESGLESTVHPARYYRENDGTPPALPSGWDRRLDSFGNLFFVDHHTKSATRLDPRFNSRIDRRTGLPTGWEMISDHEGTPFFFCQKGESLIGTYEPETLNTKFFDWKYFLSAKPKNGDRPAALFCKTQRQTLASQTLESFRTLVKENLITAPSQLADADLSRYRAMFRAASKKNLSRIDRFEAFSQCKDFGLPPALIQAILEETDKNKDGYWNPDEYAEALHIMRFALKQQFHIQGVPKATPEELEGCYAFFEAFKSRDCDVMSEDDVLKVSTICGLPNAVATEIWEQYDTNHDGKWNIDDEFANGLHHIRIEKRRRERE